MQSHSRKARGKNPQWLSQTTNADGGKRPADVSPFVPRRWQIGTVSLRNCAKRLQGAPLVFLNNRFWVSWHHLGGFHPGLDFVLQLLQFTLREILHLSMQEFFWITSLSEVKGAPFIGILKDEALVSLDGSIVRLSFYHPS